MTDCCADRSGVTAAQDDADLRYLQQVHGPVLLNYLSRLVRGDIHRAEDIVQETLLRAWRNPQARTEGGGWSRGWVFTVAKRIVIDQIRAAGLRPETIGDDDVAEAMALEDPTGRMIDAAEVRAALVSLPDRWRSTLAEIYYNDRPIAEVARMHGVSEGTVKSRTFYALRALRAELATRGFDVRSKNAEISSR